MRRTLNLISGNEGKLREMKMYLSAELEKIGVSLEMMPMDIPEIQGTSEEVIRDKILRVSSMSESAVICEDTSLCFNAWQGLPGPYM